MDEFGRPFGRPGDGRAEVKRLQADNIDALSKEFDLDEKQLNLLRSSGLFSYGDLTKYVNELLSKQYSTQDERDWDLGEISRRRSLGLNPDLQGVSGSGSIDGSGSLYPSEPFSRSEPLSNVLSGGSLSDAFNGVLGNVLKLATFGVQSYGTITDVLMQSGLKIAGLAMTDLPSFERGADGVADVESAIASGLVARGFRPGSRKASIYASTVRQHLNSLPQILKYAQDKDSYNKAIASGKISAHEMSDEYTEKVISALDLAADTKVKLQEYDFEIAKQKAEFLRAHPDYTAEQLEAELTQKTQGARKATADAEKSELDAAGTRLDNARKTTENKIAEENLKQEQSQTGRTESDNDLQQLRNSIEQTRIEGFDAMIDFCRKYEEESYKAGRKHTPEWNAWHKANEKKTQQYVEYRKRLRQAGYYQDKRMRFKGGVNAGPLSVGVGK